MSQLPIQLSPNLIITDFSSHDIREGKLQSVEITCTFYGQEYQAWLTKRNVENDCPGVTAEGPSELFESFTDNLEDEHWEKLKELFRELQQQDEEL